MADDDSNDSIIAALKQPAMGLKPYPGKGPTVQPDTPFANWAQGMGESGKNQLVGLLKHPENLVGTDGLGAPRLGALRLNPSSNPNYVKGIDEGLHDFDILNEGAGKVGSVETSYFPVERNIHVDYMNSHLNSPYKEGSVALKANPNSWSFGPKKMQDVIQELMRHFPDAKVISGRRVSGVRNGPAAPPVTYDPNYYDRPKYPYVERQLPGRE